jgi:tRNA G18 (ribose-2'-O)-methylase SpoU
MGAHFKHPAFSATWDELDTFRARVKTVVLAADAQGKALAGPAVLERAILVVGNEGAGVSAATRERADRLVSIPISGDVESLNVAVATGILLHQLRS